MDKISPNPENPPLSPFTKGGSSSFTKREIRKKLGRALKVKAQVFIETTLFFVATIFLLLMIIRVWVWSNNQMAGRQPAYNDSRVEAGTVAPPDRAAPLIWVVEDAARGDRRVYTPTRLTRDWVFRGEE